MKYEVMYDNGSRLRLRSGQWAFTKKEGYGLASLLLNQSFIHEVHTSHRNGSILIYYDEGIENKQRIFDILDKITIDDLFEAEPTQIQASNEITSDFYLKLTKMIFRRGIFKLFLPMPIRNALTIYHAAEYIWHGLDSLTSFNVDVALLDGAAVAGALLHHQYKPASSMMFLLSISDALEDYTLQKAKSTLKDSLALNIDTVWVVGDDGEEKQCPAVDIEKGDKIKIHMGDVIPVDGKVIEGEAMVNEASMTGEPLAVHKRPGKTVHAGTVIEEGNLIVEVYSMNKETRLNKIIDMIENSEALKADTQSKAEKLADSIVPYSFLATALTYLITRNPTKALSVLMVDFSCAIKLTTPLSIISAMKEASDNRMMVKGGKFLENYANADTIVFDKTGTLTNATPKVVDVIPMSRRYKRDDILRMAACIEEHFAHSIATAIVKQAKEEGLKHEEDHSEVQYIVAHGIVTEYEGKRAIIGSKHFLFDDEKVKMTKTQEKKIKKAAKEHSVVYLALDGKLEGLICIDDPVRDEAKYVIEELKELGIENVIMLTGDSESGARAGAKALGITEYRSQVLPEDKSKIIEELKAEGKTVIMVGDGINDSPALAAADVSVSMKHSSDIAREVADISLLSDDLYDLVTLRKLSVGMLDKINKNYHHIVAVNGSLLVLGVLGVIPPSTSSMVHNLSTMLFGAMSTRSVLNENEYNKGIEVEAIEVADTS
ncbi:MAG: heavy metal translocating P-type ATPase [Methanobrevibacter sp.]|uniref:heavy metal translocating P-type ATPase n=1 Tax=Methanobrevibacter sp. TaxID=66852 RepID=UPI0025E1E685|nr:heavy metal translocating P-type ATPase [Methanobrevibacter sp.]MBR3113119.1 heavy metal translocating P-type ATPase [Methanobrevibacter sp.]MBR6992499.1 heavy metal translocating P-type ATPase [Methanobrevibacter sp.]